MKANNFNDCLLFGNQGEKAFNNRCITIFKPIVEEIFYEKNPEKQKAGYDTILKRDHEVKIEIKTRGYTYWHFKDILIETISIIEYNKPGWVYYSEADFIVYLWYDSKNDEILDAYIINFKPFQKWVNAGGLLNFKKMQSQSNGGQWHTEGVMIPISEFPQDFLIKVNRGKLGSFKNIQKALMDYDK